MLLSASQGLRPAPLACGRHCLWSQDSGSKASGRVGWWGVCMAAMMMVVTMISVGVVGVPTMYDEGDND